MRAGGTPTSSIAFHLPPPKRTSLMATKRSPAGVGPRDWVAASGVAVSASINVIASAAAKHSPGLRPMRRGGVAREIDDGRAQAPRSMTVG